METPIVNILQKKQNALMILLEGSVLLSYDQKLDVVGIFPTLSEKQIDALGTFLSSEEKIREEFPEDIQKGVENVLTNIVGEKVSTPKNDNTVYIGTGKPS